MSIGLTRVLLLRAWREQDHVRVRILHDEHGDTRQVVCDSLEVAIEVVRTLLAQLQDETQC